MDKIERWKTTAEIFLKDNVKAFVKDISGDLYFCEILFVGENSFEVQCFGPEQRSGKKFVLYWMLIEDFDKYNDFEVGGK